MSFLNKLFGQRNASVDDLNAIFLPLRDSICDFKDSTNISWAAILPAAIRIGTTMLLGSRGKCWTLSYLDDHLKRLGKATTVPTSAIIDIDYIARPDQSGSAYEFITSQVGVLSAHGFPTEYIGEALVQFSIISAEQVSDVTMAIALIKISSS